MIADNDIFEPQSASYPLVGNCSGLYFLFDEKNWFMSGEDGIAFCAS
jgi:hypothetical protein